MNDINFKPRAKVFDISFGTVTAIGLVVLGLAKLIDEDAIPTLLAIGLFVYIGLGLPRWIGYAERNERARDAKNAEQQAWGFHSRNREGAWINYIDYPVVKQTAIAKDKYFYSDWLVIHNGYIIVNPGACTIDPTKTVVAYDLAIHRTYAWDGCTPKRLFYWAALIGTPDWWEQCEAVQVATEQGTLEVRNKFWPKAHHASLVHDALYQYLGTIPINKTEVNQLFYEMLIESRMPRVLASIYHWAADSFGALDAQDDATGPNSTRSVTGLPFLSERVT
ncbi:MAG: hypothetical protein M3436_17165 [Pseudomonadota bacterium]|nr:hypothetical protein [Pseudomonadota bacterium]